MPDAKQEMLTMGEVAGRSGIAPSAIRYYEDRGLIHAQRMPSGHRRFPRHVLRRLAFVVFAQRVGLSLEEIGAELARLPTDRVPTGDDWSALSERWTERIDRRMAELERLRHDLSGCIGCGCLSVESCALINPGDRLSELGQGPARWKG